MKKLVSAFIIVLLSAVLVYAEGTSLENSEGNSDRYRIGFGLGMPYGGFGAGLEAFPMDKVSIALGLGTTSGGMGWAAGVRFYPVERFGRFWPRLSAYYGIVAVLEDSKGNVHDTHSGSAFGVGVNVLIDVDYTMDFELLVVDNEPPPGYVKKSGDDVTVSIGWGFYF